jgi:hypothetical protein
VDAALRVLRLTGLRGSYGLAAVRSPVGASRRGGQQYSCSKSSVPSVAVFAPEYSSGQPGAQLRPLALRGGPPQRHDGQAVHPLRVAGVRVGRPVADRRRAAVQPYCIAERAQQGRDEIFGSPRPQGDGAPGGGGR